MQPNTEFKNIADLKPGDVILCHCDPSNDLVSKAIHSVTSSEYCHAAIYYGDSLAAESTAKDGIKKGKIEKVDVSKLISRYGHVAVLRQPDAWASDNRVEALKLFVDKVVENGAKYNFNGIFSFKSRKEFHEANIQEKLENFFGGKLSPLPTDKSEYFCSEFVSDCFIAVGFIQPSAAILFQSDTYSPGDLGKEPTFGTFWGYLTTNPSYKISEHDYYYRTTTYDVIYGV
ncbi:hypothetical protein KEF85_04970 [Methylomonas paludis]|uniref:Permuted papain-like amidase YaeF/Yiix C92 family enzyme n=1 Tax=Methylomonas paludis TaxID=1173101 RepID=A0A975RAY3_9GAMM|nr:hypothetical protein [Methylomonas paludis]QWF71823.1 hypothetical protein KEF85_04970 [Methylomonas paludis]